MSVDMWGKLGIEPTTDTAAIQAAYAAKAKMYHPEEHPEEFQELQQAYRNAIKFAKTASKSVNTRQILPNFDTIPAKSELNKVKKTSANQKGTVAAQKTVATHKETVAAQKGAGKKGTSEKESQNKFDYSEIDHDSNRDRFFREFRSIAINPYLRNNILCWEQFLGQERYDGLFHKPAFRKNLVLTICRTLKGWNKSTIHFFNGWLKRFQADSELPETDMRCWIKKMNFPLEKNPLTFAMRIPTKEQKEMHKNILLQAQAGSRKTDFNDPEVMAEYLSLYLQYAYKNSERLEHQYENSKMVILFLATMLFVIIFFICMNIHINHYYATLPSAQ